MDYTPRSYLIETNKGILRKNWQHILLDRRGNNYKSRTIGDCNSIMITRPTDVTNDPSNTNDTKNELNNENANDPFPIRTLSGRRVARSIRYNDYVTSRLYKYLKGEILCYYLLSSSSHFSAIFVYVSPSILPLYLVIPMTSSGSIDMVPYKEMQ